MTSDQSIDDVDNDDDEDDVDVDVDDRHLVAVDHQRKGKWDHNSNHLM